MIFPKTDCRITLVHERFTDFAGSEKVVSELARRWPKAEVLAPIVRDAGLDDVLRGRVQGGALTRLTRGPSYAHLLPLLPLAMRRLPVGDTDLVIASHHAFANQVVHATPAPVISYVHTPARWIWDPSTRAGEMGGRAGASVLAAFAAAYRPADRRAAERVHTLVANSSAVAQRIQTWWGRDATVVHPPVDTTFYTPQLETPREDFFLLAGRLVPYKRPDLAIRAAERAGVRLIVAGDGRYRAECERLGGANTSFVGQVDDATQRDLFRRCSALLMPGVEDFGIVPVEAQACGAPVLATAVGGALDTVIPGRTGRLLSGAADPDSEAAVALWADALNEHRAENYDSAAIRAHAETFSRAAFDSAMDRVIARVLS